MERIHELEAKLEAALEREEKNEKLALRYYGEITKLKKRLGADDPWHNVADTKLIEKLRKALKKVCSRCQHLESVQQALKEK